MTNAGDIGGAVKVSAEGDTTQGSSTGEPIDRRYLARFTLGNMALEREVLELFAGQMPRYVEQLRAAANGKEWMLAAHTIKGSALAVGARRLASLAQMAERLDMDAYPADCENMRRDATNAVAAASNEACLFIACLFATD
jgi:HPt (histidine-containing phosphotransfer) domain-containing protein